MNSSEVAWLYVDMNSFFASCEQHANPSLREKPIAVVPSMAETTSVLAASYEAKYHGVKTGVKVAEARKMCPHIQFVTSHHDLYIRTHHLVYEVIETCIPIFKICSIDEYACALTGSHSKLERALEIAEQIRIALREKIGPAITASIGISTNKLLAKIACDMKKPNAITSITLKDLPHKLHSIKLNDIPGVGRKMFYHLNQSGITSVEQLLKLDEKKFYAIWGNVWGARMYLWLKGRDFEAPATKTSSMGHEHVLPPKLRNHAGATLTAKKLLNKAAIRLRKNSYYAKRLSLYISMTGYNNLPLEQSVKFPESRNTIFFMEELRKMLEKLPRNCKPLKVSVTFSDLTQKSEHQLSFFENNKLDKISETMDLINKKFGREFIHLGSLHEDCKVAPSAIAFQRIPDFDEI